MAKIPKNLSDKAMLKGFEEPESYETIFLASEKEAAAPVKPRKAGGQQRSLEQSFVEPELAEQVGRALMELKLELFKQGIVDYHIKVSRESGRILLTPVPDKRAKAKQ